MRMTGETYTAIMVFHEFKMRLELCFMRIESFFESGKVWVSIMAEQDFRSGIIQHIIFRKGSEEFNIFEGIQWIEIIFLMQPYLILT